MLRWHLSCETVTWLDFHLGRRLQKCPVVFLPYSSRTLALKDRQIIVYLRLSQLICNRKLPGSKKLSADLSEATISRSQSKIVWKLNQQKLIISPLSSNTSPELISFRLSKTSNSSLKSQLFQGYEHYKYTIWFKRSLYDIYIPLELNASYWLAYDFNLKWQ